MNVALNRYHYAVVVGINFYTVSDILGPLSGPLNDARMFAQWLEKDGGLHPDNIREVPASASSSEEPLKPTLTEIHETLSNVNNELFEIQRMRQPGVPIPEPVPGSRLYIFVAGHGMARKGVTAALFSTEAGKAGVWAVLSLGSCLQWYLDSGPFEEVVMFADVCRKRYEGVPIMNLPFGEYKRPGDKRLITYYATSDGDLAYEDPAISTLNPDDCRGYFSKALTECLSTAVDAKRGYVTSISLAESVSTRVQELSKGKVRPPQDCRAEGALYPPLRFGPMRNGYPVTIRIARQVQSQELQLLDGSLNLIESFFPQAAGDEWERRLLPGLYNLAWANTSTADDEGTSFKVVNKPELVYA
jgi:hypothetical protein